MSDPHPVPTHPQIILIPTLPHTPDLTLLKELTDQEVAANELCSVTYSPVLCPEDKRHLYTLKPYYWELAPGQWERRDGHRNPYCDLPQGQKQLEGMATAVHVLSLGMTHLPETEPIACRKRLEEVLRVFFVDEETKMLPQTEFTQCDPTTQPIKGTFRFVISTRYLILVSRCLSSIMVDPSVNCAVRSWFNAHVEWMITSEQGQYARNYHITDPGDNVARWYHAALFTHLGYVLSEPPTQQATKYFAEISSLSPGTYFAGCIAKPATPRHNVVFMLEPTFMLADQTTPPGFPPIESALKYLQELIEYAKTVGGGEEEVEVNNDERFGIKLGWFEKILKSWSGEQVNVALDESPWEGGWKDYSKLMWSGL